VETHAHPEELIEEGAPPADAAEEPPLEHTPLHRLTLRFRDPQLEGAFLKYYFRHNLANLRVAHLGGLFLWIVWGFVVRGSLLPSDQALDLQLRLGVFIPLVVIGLALTFLPGYRRFWEWEITGLVLLTTIMWVYYVSQIVTVPVDYGYVGLILIGAFTYTLIRLRFVLVVLVVAVSAAMYIPYAIFAVHIFGLKTLLASFYLLTFGGLGGVAAYRLEQFTRLLFLRERQLERERERSDALLLNVLPQAIVDRLKAHPNGERVADAFDEVSVLFADAVDSTEHAARTSPEEFAETLDKLFRLFDEIADRYGLEKIKTIGDAYMAVAGAPVPMKGHADRAANAALDMLKEAGQIRWPTGDPIVVRVGLATGPAVAGVIGHRKFAYDLWGDTVNLASRLSETSGQPGKIQCTEPVAQRLAGRYEFTEPRMLDLKGKGPTQVRFLLARRSPVAADPSQTPRG
jgi:class 3 adenylate cyclase